MISGAFEQPKSLPPGLRRRYTEKFMSCGIADGIQGKSRLCKSDGGRTSVTQPGDNFPKTSWSCRPSNNGRPGIWEFGKAESPVEEVDEVIRRYKGTH
jgi:hypothetical protein